MGPPPPQAEGEKRKDTGGGSDGEAMAIGSIDAGMGAVGGFDGKELGFSKGSGVEVSKGIDLVSHEVDSSVGLGVVILKKPQAEEQHITVTEGAKEVISGSSRAVVTELLTELENLSVKATLDGDVSNTWKDLRLFLNNLSSSTESEKWVTLGDQDHRQTSPPREKQAPVEVTSPNSFELLQYIREEGEIDEDEELLGEEAPKQQNEEGVDVLDEGTNGDDKVGRKKTGQGAGQRGKGR
ncbi:hypothetical protein Bca101_092013 [Brassica carinata]